jgi:quercetin dioxygenase-like cupin family protein
MTRMRILTVGMWMFGLACGLGSGTAFAQQAPPTENKGVSVGKTAAIDLGPEIQGMQGRQLRMRVITVEPGGQIRNHSHQDWPEVVYVMQGMVIEYRGSQTKEYRMGDTFQGDKDTTHWLENKGTTPVVLIVADVFKQP